MKWIKLALRIIISTFFVVSALGKLQSIDGFEVFVYRISGLGYDASTIAARLLIGLEMLIAACILFKIKFRLIWWVTLLVLLGFSGFLLFQIFSGSEENCFCLGELVDFSPTESLIKNILLAGILIWIGRTKDLGFRGHNLVFSVLVIAALAAPLLISPPDIFVAGRFNPAQHDQNALNEAIINGEIPEDFVRGRKLLSFYSTGCKFCQMSATRLGVLVNKSNVDSQKMNIVFWGDSTVKATEFFEITHSPVLNYSTLESRQYLEITKGRMPLILLIEDGVVEQKMNYRTIDEKAIQEFLNQEY